MTLPNRRIRIITAIYREVRSGIGTWTKGLVAFPDTSCMSGIEDAQFAYHSAVITAHLRRNMAMTMTNPSIIFRIVWCRRLRKQAPTQSEEEGWRAEEQGLRDALLTRDHSYHYRSQLPSVFDRYLLGFRDAHALIRMASIAQHLTQASDNTHVSSPRLSEGITGDAHINTLVLDEQRPAHSVLRCLLEHDNDQVLEASHSRHGLERSAALLITDLAMTKM